MPAPQHHDHEHHDHDHASGHSHGHGHAHSHAPANFDRAFAIGIALNVGFVVVEAAYGIAANSLALLADAGHNLGDVLGLVMAWGAATLVRRRPTARYTYGLKRSSILVSLANAGLLLVAISAIVWEAVQRLGRPEPVAEMTVIWVALVAIDGNADQRHPDDRHLRHRFGAAAGRRRRHRMGSGATPRQAGTGGGDDGHLGGAGRHCHQWRDRAALHVGPQIRPQHQGGVPAYG